MKNLFLFAVLVSLPLLLGGCGEKHEGISLDELQNRGKNGYFEKNQEVGYTGKVFKLHENGQIELKGQLIKGKFDGLKVRWYKNGQKEEETNWNDGERDGPWLSWHYNGKKSYEGNYKDGKLVGVAVLWHKNGKKQEETNWKDGEKISGKYWNRKGEPVDSREEARRKGGMFRNNP